MQDGIKHIMLDYGLAVFILSVAIILVIAGVRSNRNITKQICYNLTAVFVAFFIYEVWPVASHTEEENHMEGSYTQDYFEDNEVLGYGPSKDSMTVTSRKLLNGSNTVVYDVVYTIRQGLRYTPNTKASSKKHALFFGGSFMFGEGLNDNETMPYYYNEFKNCQFEVRNYGFHGYGPHQALATIESKVVNDEELLDSDTVNAFYFFIPTHIARAKGSSWDQAGPRYEVVDGKLRHEGSFKENRIWLLRNKLGEKILTIWNRSKIYNSFFQQKIDDTDILRTALIIEKMNVLLTERNMNFTVVLSKSNGVESELEKYSRDRLIHLLNEKGVTNYKIEEIIDDYENSGDKYAIKNEGHPNSLHNKLVANFLARQ
ncbi:hypothetical protein K8352_02870 [Flavobacteriaceae bacterium F89]|uniref:Uncharacterized protein n=1 Tax=Cerina litoralis TaxID=2874477 RepID=A0AAE3ERQ4_9FLAO|nr:hypothetical protein [Cerina litoralis]MCG2459683.1 hypothetical protein [Cerina litoralis]